MSASRRRGQGQVDAFKQALVRQIPKLRAYALNLSRSASEADDLVQETLLRAWRCQAQFEPGTNIGAWLFRILRNEFLAQSRRRSLFVQDEEGRLAGKVTAQPDQEWRLRCAEMLSALEKVPAASREALLVVVVGGLSYEDAAAVCGCDANAVKQRVHRARRRLGELVGDDRDRRGWAAKPRALRVPATKPVPV